MTAIREKKGRRSHHADGYRSLVNDLITLCWFHHHIAVHREGLQIVRTGRSRVRLKRPR